MVGRLEELVDDVPSTIGSRHIDSVDIDIIDLDGSLDGSLDGDDLGLVNYNLELLLLDAGLDLKLAVEGWVIAAH